MKKKECAKNLTFDTPSLGYNYYFTSFPRRLLPLNIKELYLYGTNMYAYYNR